MTEGAPEDESLKRRLLMRAGMAAGLIAVLLLGLALYDRTHRAPPPAAPGPAEQVPPAARVAQPEANTAPAAAASPGPIEASPADVAQADNAPSEPEMASAPEQAPPARRQVDGPEPRRGTERLVLGGEATAPPHPARPAPAAPAAAAPSPGPAPASAPAEPARAPGDKSYLVQLGVFVSPENAEALRAKLEGMGIPARLESRVVLGPFPDQAAARAAQTRLREAGQNAGLIVSPRH